MERTRPLVTWIGSNLFFCDFYLHLDFLLAMNGVDFINRLDDDSFHGIFDNFQTPAQFLPFGQGEKSLFFI